jgi:uncharacterized delta-60 repeat protein/uncharacterized repeat protein (TIGR01451 family)
MKNLLQVFLVITFISTNLFAQPGTLDPSFNPGTGIGGEGNTTSIQTDGKIIVGGQIFRFNDSLTNNIVRLNSNGSLDASFNTGAGFDDIVYSTCIQADGKIIVGGDFSTFNGISNNGIVRLNTDGSLDTSFRSAINWSVKSISLQIDGKIIVGGDSIRPLGNGYFQFESVLARLNIDGSIDTTFNLGTGFTSGNTSNSRISTISIQTDGKIIVGGDFSTFNGIPRKAIARLNANGSLDTTFYQGTLFGISGYVSSTIIQTDGKIIVGGFFANNIARLNTDGSLDTSFNPSWIYPVNSIKIQLDGKIVVSASFVNRVTRLNTDGSFDSYFIEGMDAYRIRNLSLQQDGKIIVVGNVIINGILTRIARFKGDKGILGKVNLDINENCQIDSVEAGLAGRNLIVNPGNVIVQTQNNGYWFIDSLPPGTYTITIDTSNQNWIPTCPIAQTFTVVHPDSFVQGPNFGFVSSYPCPSPYVNIIMPRIRRGFSNQEIYVNACNVNIATGILDSAFTIVTLPAQISLQSASRTYTSLGNNRYKFYLGNIYPGQCINFTINATVSTAAVANQTLCMSAELFPQADCVFDSIPTHYQNSPSGSVTPCTLPWDRSSLRVEGECVGDSVRFVIYNTGSFGGGDMDCFAPVRVYVDGQWVLLDSIRINGGDSVVFMFAGTGGTIRLEADQHPLHPGNSRPNANVENCGNGTWTPGIINTMPQDDADPIIDIYCGQVTAPYDPNDKTGFPLGLGSSHAIRQNQQIEYLIRFQNVGTDTAVNVVIRDTLTTDLNIFTVQSGVSSHPYEFRMYGPRVLEWKFNNIMLPDSNTNEPASNGFVKFTVEQNPDLPFGTVIENSAAIYFDFEAPVITNTYFHTIHDFSINVSVEPIEGAVKFVDVKVIPNPFSNTAQLKLEGLENTDYLELEIFNLSGQRMQFLNNSQNGQFQLSRGEMSQGIYFFSVRQNGKVVARGKMVVE